MDTAPAEFLSKIHVADLNSSIYVFVLGRRYAVWKDQSRSFDWYDLDEDVSVGTHRTALSETLLQRFWTYYAQLVLSDLNQRDETSKEALERIPRQWREWSRPRVEKFTAKWIDAAAWPPALAFSWIMFKGDWRRIAAYLKYGQYIPTSGWFLKGLSVHPDAEAAKHAANDLIWALRAKPGSKRVIVQGVPVGQDRMGEINPIELATLEWMMEPNRELGAALGRPGVVIYTHVLVDAASLIQAIPGSTPQAPQNSEGFGKFDKKLKIREIAEKVVKAGMSSKQRDKAICQAFEAEKLAPPGGSLIKVALAGTGFIKPRKSTRFSR
jgi:hypothetical protein